MQNPNPLQQQLLNHLANDAGALAAFQQLQQDQNQAEQNAQAQVQAQVQQAQAQAQAQANAHAQQLQQAQDQIQQLQQDNQPDLPEDIPEWDLFHSMHEDEELINDLTEAQTLATKFQLLKQLSPLRYLICPWCSGYGHKAADCTTGNKIRNVVLQDPFMKLFLRRTLEPLKEAQAARQ